MTIGAPGSTDGAGRYSLLCEFAADTSLPVTVRIEVELGNGTSVEADHDALVQAIADTIEGHADWRIFDGRKQYQTGPGLVTSP